MLNMKFAAVALAAAALAAAASGIGSAKEPIVMNVAGRDVPLSEFQYLYNKNNIQQQNRQSIDEYVKMFVDYKLRVADALAEKLDTLPEYKAELQQHRMELAEPYFIDSLVVDSLVRTAYSRMETNVDVDHIMLSLVAGASTTAQQKAKLDSIRALISAGNADFYDMAKQYSVDPSVKSNGGHIGFITPNIYPEAFENMVYSTPVGEMSPVFKTRFGYHLIRVNGTRKNPGEVKASHILKLTRNLSEEQKAEKRHEIDSLYAVVAAPGANFAEVARRESEDPGSARNGGELPWFGPGRMVPEFEKAAFELAAGQISRPVATAYGYHIIKNEGHRPLAPLDSIRDNLVAMVNRGERAELIQDRSLAPYAKKYPASINAAARDSVRAVVARFGKLDSKTAGILSAYDIPAATVGDKSVKLPEIASQMMRLSVSDQEAALEIYDIILKNHIRSLTREIAVANLENTEPAYRNLMNEYRDGMLLYEISNRKVWDKANKDVEGQQKYFLAHRDNYKWSAPKYKGYVISAITDSLADEAVRYVQENNFAPDSLVRQLRIRFSNDVKIERALAAKGDNVVIDYVAFGGKRPDAIGRWSAFRQVSGRIIEQPEEAADVRGAVSVDYQKMLESEWLDELHKKYPVKINKKALKKVR